MIKDLESKDLKGICEKLENVLETVTIPEYPVIEQIKKFLKNHGAMGSLMSGSGPTIFGIYKDKKTAREALAALKDMKEVRQAYVVDPVDDPDQM